MSSADDERERLALAAAELAREVQHLNKDFSKQALRLSLIARKNRRMIWGLIISLVLDITLTILLALNFVNLDSNSHRINTLTQRLDAAQTVQRQKALCPLYQLFEDAKKFPSAPQPGQTKAQAEVARAHAFKIIDEGYDALGCKTFLH